VGERFARALAAKDSGALCALLADPLDFQALTPGRHWQAGTGRQAVEEIIQRRRTADHLDAGPVLRVPVVPGVRPASVPVAGSGISPWLAANRLASARLVVPVLV
jgi:hypothetical protein